MNTNYKLCPICGVRSFADDTFCGVCKTPLGESKRKTDTQKSDSPINYLKVLAAILGVLFLVYVIFVDGEEKPKTINETSKENVLSNSPETQLAIINDKSDNPKQITINLFANYLNSIFLLYANTPKQKIANALVAGHNMIVKEGLSDSLLEFTSAFVGYSKNLDAGLNFSLEETLALFIKVVYMI